MMSNRKRKREENEDSFVEYSYPITFGDLVTFEYYPLKIHDNNKGNNTVKKPGFMIFFHTKNEYIYCISSKKFFTPLYKNKGVLFSKYACTGSLRDFCVLKKTFEDKYEDSYEVQININKTFFVFNTSDLPKMKKF